MKIITIITFLITLCFSVKSAELSDVKINFASIKLAKKLLMQEDEYTKNWSPFDIDSRMQKKNSSKSELLDFIKSQALEWEILEIKKIDSILSKINSLIKLNKYNLDFPEELIFIKSTTKDEGGVMGYTRANYIVLKDEVLYNNDNELSHLILHELFHILSRNNPKFRKSMYEIIGFNIVNSIKYPESIINYKISNPDATQSDSYINLLVEGKKIKCMMILYSKEKYESGIFLDYINIGFLSLKGDKKLSIEYVDNNPVIYEFKQVSGFIEQIGMNTGYIIDPEEIIAENFSMAILDKTDLPSQDIINKIKDVLIKK